MRKKILFIINPKAGKQQIKNYLLDILDIFVKESYDTTVYITQSRGDAINVTEERAKEYDLVVCSGGDGTLNEVVSGMMKSKKKVPIGYLPAGTTNDFAGSLHIPKNLIAAANTIVKGQTYSCDIGSFNDYYFTYVAAFGLFTDVPYETKQETKNILGYLAYILEGIKRLNEMKSYRLKVEYNGNSLTDDFIFGMITNSTPSTAIGGFLNLNTSNAYINDGLFEVTLIKRPKSAMELQEIITALLTQDFNKKHIITFKSNHLVITGNNKISWTVDGEFGGEHEKVIITNLREEIKIIAPIGLEGH
ncbi:MAG: YegS/Rv2252/BmrU family lipid kinase [Clostridiales bacterium]|jgi:diacylglycerol kinase (ATP)|nr:YegS/Rv2252/BmrU family lipid kinase [Clostridiales bacterium]